VSKFPLFNWSLPPSHIICRQDLSFLIMKDPLLTQDDFHGAFSRAFPFGCIVSFLPYSYPLFYFIQNTFFSNPCFILFAGIRRFPFCPLQTVFFLVAVPFSSPLNCYFPFSPKTPFVNIYVRHSLMRMFPLIFL